MNFLTAYMKGWARALALPHIALIKWLHNLLFAAMLTVPFAGLLQNDLDHSLSADRLLQTVPYDIYTEFTIHHDGAFSSIHLALMSGVIVFMLLAWFLAGGTLGALSAERRPTTAEFFADCAKYFWSMSWVTIVSFLFGGLVLVLFYGGMEWTLARVEIWSSGPKFPFWITWPFYAIFALLATFVLRVADYARLAVVSCEPRRALSAFVKGLAFTWRKPLSTLALWVTGLGVVVAVVGAMAWAQSHISGLTTWWGPLLIGQLTVLFRIFGRMAWMGSEVRFMTDVTPRAAVAAPVTEPHPEPADPSEYF
ncbi:MAG: hypothetical protein KDC35_17165 [Acidobacteria bacterium]|nr:hypothetical protein [Acidobacteriota bacterium]